MIKTEISVNAFLFILLLFLLLSHLSELFFLLFILKYHTSESVRIEELRSVFIFGFYGGELEAGVGDFIVDAFRWGVLAVVSEGGPEERGTHPHDVHALVFHSCSL